MNKKFFLYIDILGFKELVRESPYKVKLLYAAIDALNAHKHGAFKTIVFSDTILTFNINGPYNTEDCHYLVMYLCEFVQDLQKWCIKLEIHFKAFLLHDEFYYERKEHIEAYYGNALISAYLGEKNFNAMGLFIARDIVKFNNVFKTSPYNNHFDFVFLTQNLEDALLLGKFPIPCELLYDAPNFPFLKHEVNFLKLLRTGIDYFETPRVKEKYINTYSIYKNRYKFIVEELEKSNFDMTVVNSEVDWEDITTDWWDISTL